MCIVFNNKYCQTSLDLSRLKIILYATGSMYFSTLNLKSNKNYVFFFGLEGTSLSDICYRSFSCVRRFWWGDISEQKIDL